MDYENIIEEVMADYSPFFEFTWNLLYDMTYYANVNFFGEGMANLRWTYQRTLEHEEAIRPILAECRELMA